MLENCKINIPRASVFFSFCLNKSTKFNKGEEKKCKSYFSDAKSKAMFDTKYDEILLLFVKIFFGTH